MFGNYYNGRNIIEGRNLQGLHEDSYHLLLTTKVSTNIPVRKELQRDVS